MAEADQIIEEARRSLVRLISQLMQTIERLSAEIERFGAEIEQFRTALEQQAPGVGAAIRQYPVEQVPGRLDATSPGWELPSDQFVRTIPTDHPVYADPQTREAASLYFGHDQRIRTAVAARVAREARQNFSSQNLATPPTPVRPDRSQPTQPQPTQPPAQPPAPAPAQPTPSAQPQASQPQAAQPQSGQPEPAQVQPEHVQPAQAQAEQGQAGVPGTVRVLEAPGAGAVTLNANMTRAAGRVVVVADPDCTQARITISTADRTGPSAEAVEESGRTAGPDRSLSVDVTGPSSRSSWEYQSSSGTVFSSEAISHTGTGSVYVGNFGDLNFRNGNVSRADGQPFPGPNVRTVERPSQIEIHAVVPEGSSVYCETDSANIETRGKVDVVDAHSAAGNVTVDQATEVRAESAAGNVTVDQATQVRAESAAGNVRVRHAETVHAQSGAGSVRVGDATAVTASSGSGNVRVDAGETVRATSGSGDVEVGTAGSVTAQSGSGDVRVNQAGNATVASGAGEVSVGAATEVSASTGRGDISIGQADKVFAESHSGAVEVGTTKDATVRSKHGDVIITDLRGSASATSGTGEVSVHANDGGKVTAGSATGKVSVTASEQAIASGLTVNAEGPSGRVHVQKGAHTPTGTAAGAGERDRTGPARAAPARTNQAAAPTPGTGQTGTARSQD